ncbi:hypothetical protein [Lactobacillus melliventris]|uniref:Uncharacterized protein n=1 Tax=Lactobacillus melliventris TaxID=1218507 RepID=A0A0F4LEL4_9LACO|nr:hypothetical protein [Lactobacillus melliventris]KJY56709.1 hypothetical protein JF74_10610 [Lactobacillus melliventris]
MKLTNNEFKITYIRTVDSTVIENSNNKPIDFEDKNIENIIPGKEYYGFFQASISGEYGYEIHKNLKTDKDGLKIYLECTNSSVEILKDNFYTLTRRNWTSGLFPDNLPDNCLRKWSKTGQFYVKYKALESASVLKTNDIKLKYKIITLK